MPAILDEVYRKKIIKNYQNVMDVTIRHELNRMKKVCTCEFMVFKIALLI